MGPSTLHFGAPTLRCGVPCAPRNRGDATGRFVRWALNAPSQKSLLRLSAGADRPSIPPVLGAKEARRRPRPQPCSRQGWYATVRPRQCFCWARAGLTDFCLRQVPFPSDWGMPAIDRAGPAGYSGAQGQIQRRRYGGGFAEIVIPVHGAADRCKSLMCNEFTDFCGPHYSASRHVIPQFCGIYQS